jgi:exopolysaccharide biosynthesis polyprenyl glycosylphosphotransferase
MTETLAVPGQATSFDATLADWSVPVDRPFVPVARRRLDARSSRLSDLLAAVHGAHETPGQAAVALAVDLVVVAVAVQLVAGSPALAVSFPLAFVLLSYLAQVYKARDTVQTRGFLWYPGRVVAPLTVAALGAVAAGSASIAAATTLSLVTLGLLTALRGLTWSGLVLTRRRGLGLRRTLIIGDGESAGTVWRRLVEFPEAGLRPTQLLTFEAAHVPGRVERELAGYGIRHVVLVAPGPEEGLLTSALPRHDTDAPFFSTVPPLAELFLDPRSVSEVGGIPLIPLGRVTESRRTFAGKRALDTVVAALMGLVLLPLAVAVALAIKLDDGGPVFYRQSRIGRNGASFPMLKFRTMVVGADTMLAGLGEDNISDGLLFKMRNDPRITRVGRLLRKTSLDELPQLWNVLTGTMSLVGPRPLPVNAEDFAPMEAERHTVLPGITGYWQLSGGPELTYGEMIRLDLSYIRNWSLWLDFRLLMRTVPAMLHRHGAA